MSTPVRRLLLCLLLALGVLARPVLARYPESEERTIEAVKKVKPSVVRIDTMHPAARRPGVGSGVILRHDGFILTNFHVIRHAQIIHVTMSNNKMFTAQVWNASPQYDLAILKVEADNLPVPRFGDSSHLELGQMAIAIGTPLRFSWTVTVGTISALDRTIPLGDITYHNLIQTDAAINPGSSGGALIDSDGEVIGINTLVYTGSNPERNAQGLGFAIPINDALKVAMALFGHQHIAAPSSGGSAWLGIEGKDVTADMAQAWDFNVRSGVLVTAVTPESPAAAAGIRTKDIITGVAGTTVHNVRELKAAMSTHRAGDTVDFVLWSMGKSKKTITVKLEAISR